LERIQESAGHFFACVFFHFRNSTALVEAAFDGNLDEVQLNIQKGYHLESVDGRKHTALSEAACQGHLDVINYLLQSGADPNAANDVGRTPMWRASFNGHLEVVHTLLEAGGNPDSRDKTSMESVFDVAATDEMRTLLVRFHMLECVLFS
jgi:ankyrin repeat protein